jgi:multidrug efflux pump subunit AcrA (membrane-fusion protein)
VEAQLAEREGRSVFVARGNTAVKLPVKLGATYRDKVVIAEGVEPDDAIITLGHRRLEEGHPIKIAL